MKKKFLLFALFLCNLFYSQVGIGIPDPDKSAMLDVVSSTKGVLVSRMTTAQRDAIPSPANALTIFNLTEQCYNYYDLPTTVWKSLCAGGSTTPVVTALTCGSATITGNVIAGQAVSGATLTVPYTGGNGSSYPAGTPIAVSGGTVAGLTLTLQAGNLAIGAGSLVYTISGTPSAAGTAVFTLPFGGKTCTDATVTATASPSATALTCSSATQSGTLTLGTPASGVTFTVPYSGGNGTTYSAGAGIASTGVLGLTATLLPGTLHTGSGTLTYNITGTPLGSGLANFNLTFGGATCTGASVTVNNVTFSALSDNFAFSGFVGQQAFVICSDGSVKAQGYNPSGELGTGNTTSTTSGATSAFNMLGFDSSNPAIGLAAGNEHTLILRIDGTVWATGNNAPQGALGQNTITGNAPTPMQVKGIGGAGFLTGVAQISAGYRGSYALKSDGTVWAWGNNDEGQLGDGTNVAKSTPIQVLGVGGSGFLTGINQIATTPFQSNHTCAVRNDGSAFCWGGNSTGQTGDGTIVDKKTPTQVKGPGGVGFLSNVKAITVSRQGTCAVLNDGTVYAWGYNQYGELGQNTSGATATTTPVQVKGVGGSGFLTGIIDVKATSYGYMALKNDGTVYTWGFGGYGSNGDGTTTQRNAPVQVVGVGGVGFLTGIAAIQGGYLTAGALGSNGVIYGWGKNDYNGLAPTVSPTGNQTTPVALTNFCTLSNTFALTCTGIQTGTLTVGTAASGVSFTVPYINGDGTAYSAGTGIASTGVTGLTATLVAGTLTNGSGTLTYNVTGTPLDIGSANFNIIFAGKTCTSGVKIEPVTPPNPNNTICTGGTLLKDNSYPYTTTIGGKSLTITVGDTTTASSNSGSCGVPNTQTIRNNGSTYTTYYFSQPVSNLTMTLNSMDGIHNNEYEKAVFTAKLNGVAVIVTPTLFGSSCSSAFSVTGSTVNAIDNVINNVTGTWANIGGVYFDELTISRSSANNVEGFEQTIGICDLAISPRSLTTSCTSVDQTQSPSGSLVNGQSYNGTVNWNYTGGNGTSTFGASIQTINGLTLSRSGGTVSNGAGSVVYTLTGTYTGVTNEAVVFPISLFDNSCSVTFGDAIRAALSLGGCTSCSAYDAASVDSWVTVTAAEYAQLGNTMGLTTGGKSDTDFANFTPSDNQAGYSVLDNNSHQLLPANNYVVAFSAKVYGSASTDSHLKYSTNTTGSYIDDTKMLIVPASGSVITMYNVRKKPSSVVNASSRTYIAVWTGSTGKWLGFYGGSSQIYSGGDTTTLGSSAGGGYIYQVKGTPNKRW